MRNPDYEKLFLELLGPLPDLEDLDRQKIKEMTAADLDRLVPLIDEMCYQAECRGRLQSYLEIASERLTNEQRRASKTAN